MDVRKMAKCGTGSAVVGPDSPVVLSVKVLFSYPGESTERKGFAGAANCWAPLSGNTSDEYESSLQICLRLLGSTRSETLPALY